MVVVAVVVRRVVIVVVVVRVVVVVARVVVAARVVVDAAVVSRGCIVVAGGTVLVCVPSSLQAQRSQPSELTNTMTVDPGLHRHLRMGAHCLAVVVARVVVAGVVVARVVVAGVVVGGGASPRLQPHTSQPRSSVKTTGYEPLLQRHVRGGVHVGLVAVGLSVISSSTPAAAAATSARKTKVFTNMITCVAAVLRSCLCRWGMSDSSRAVCPRVDAGVASAAPGHKCGGCVEGSRWRVRRARESGVQGQAVSYG